MIGSSGRSLAISQATTSSSTFNGTTLPSTGHRQGVTARTLLAGLEVAVDRITKANRWLKNMEEWPHLSLNDVYREEISEQLRCQTEFFGSGGAMFWGVGGGWPR